MRHKHPPERQPSLNYSSSMQVEELFVSSSEGCQEMREPQNIVTFVFSPKDFFQFMF